MLLINKAHVVAPSQIIESRFFKLEPLVQIDGDFVGLSGLSVMIVCFATKIMRIANIGKHFVEQRR